MGLHKGVQVIPCDMPHIGETSSQCQCTRQACSLPESAFPASDPGSWEEFGLKSLLPLCHFAVRPEQITDNTNRTELLNIKSLTI